MRTFSFSSQFDSDNDRDIGASRNIKFYMKLHYNKHSYKLCVNIVYNLKLKVMATLRNLM